MKLAVKLSDIRVTGIDPLESVVDDMKDHVNKKDLFALADPDSVLIRYPPANNTFLQRGHTFVSGSDAYPELQLRDDVDILEASEEGKLSNSGTAGAVLSTVAAAANGAASSLMQVDDTISGNISLTNALPPHTVIRMQSQMQTGIVLSNFILVFVIFVCVRIKLNISFFFLFYFAAVGPKMLQTVPGFSSL